MADNSKFILPAVLVIGGFLFFDKIMKALGLTKNENEVANDTNRQTALDQAVRTSGKPSKSDAEWSQIADIIYQDLRYSRLDNDRSDAAYQLARPKNLADVYKLVQFFGTRTRYQFGLPTMEGGLAPFVRAVLSDKQIAAVNDNYRRKGIKFQW